MSRQRVSNCVAFEKSRRRNLHPDQASYLRGKRYNGEKASVGGDRGNQHTVASSQNDNQPKTHERLAEEYKVSPATITRDGQYAAAVDSLASVGVDAQSVIAHASKADVIATRTGWIFYQPVAGVADHVPAERALQPYETSRRRDFVPVPPAHARAQPSHLTPGPLKIITLASLKVTAGG